VEEGGLQACGKTGKRLLGIRFTGTGAPTEALEGFDFLVTVLAPCLSTVRWACGWRCSEYRSTQRWATPP
jgi:hypothetical protein